MYVKARGRLCGGDRRAETEANDEERRERVGVTVGIFHLKGEACPDDVFVFRAVGVSFVRDLPPPF